MAQKPKVWIPRVEGATTRRMARLARRALEAYDLRVASLAPLGVSQNWMFELRTEDGRRFAVRVNRPGMRTPLDIASEMHWLAALRRDTDLVVPEPIPDRDGRPVQVVAGPGRQPGVIEDHAIAVFGWIDGATVGDRIGPRTARAMGEALGRLQDHADRFVPPVPFTTSRLARAYTFGSRPEVLDEGAPEHPWFPRERRERIERAAVRVQGRIDALHADPAALRFLHIDLHAANVKRQPGGGLALLDFDDSRWAHPAQDVGIALYYLWVRPRGEALWDAWAEGYASVRGDLPADRATLETLVAGRQVDLLSFVLEARLLADSAMPAWLDRVEERLRRLEPR
jgi:Ser/Thr protein kinase RdoA (MazF antagonist)